MKITLHTKSDELDTDNWKGIYDGTHELEGLTRQTSVEEIVGDAHEIPHFTFPQIGEARFYDGDISDSFVAEIVGRRWKIDINLGYDSDGFPGGGFVTFEETTGEETPFTDGKPLGDCNQVFGQPSFIQNEVFPHHNGKCAYLLAVIESGWGDAGNENLFVALDEDGTPCGLYHEYSCY